MSRPYRVSGPPRFAHQRAGLRRLIETGGRCALLMDPGTGKTATTLDYAGLLALKSPTGEARVLVVAPLVAVDTWVAQAATYLSPDLDYWAEAMGGSLLERAEALASRGGRPYPSPLNNRAPRRRHRAAERALHHDRALAWGARSSVGQIRPEHGPNALGTPRLIIQVVNMDTFSQRQPVGSRTMADVMVDAVTRYAPDLIVVDESHRIKSPSSNVSRLLSRLEKVTRRRVILTGTVMPHSPLDVYGQWRFLDPFAFGDKTASGQRRRATFGGFKNRYAKLGGWMGKEIVGYRNLDHMQEVMAQNAIVVRKADALDLPPTQDAEVAVHLSPRETVAYQQMKNDLMTMLEEGTATSDNRLTQMLRLRQITSGHLPDDEGVKRVLGTSKADTIASLVHDTLIGEKRIVIFALFTAEIDLLRERLEAKGTELLVITGATPVEERMRMRQRFGSDDPKRLVMIAQIKTMSLAVNELVTASHAIFASMSQQRDDYIQARDRLDRIGQTRPVTFWHAVAPGTVDEVILQSHRERTNLEDSMLRHIRGDVQQMTDQTGEQR